MFRSVSLTVSILFFHALHEPEGILAIDDQQQNGGIKKMLADTCRKHQVPSLTIAVIRSDETLAIECSGVRKRGTNDKVELADLHPIGSCTKSLTSTLAAALVETGKIDWDTTISQVWPQAGERHLHPDLRDVTLDELLSHQSGLASDLEGKAWISFFDEKNSPTAERRRMLALILKRKPEHERGEHQYSNLGYVVAAAMLERRFSDSFENLMHHYVFKPLGMGSAHFRTLASAKKLKEPLLWGHIADGSPINPKIAGAENPSVYASCGTVNLTIADYAKYAQWHLKGKNQPLVTLQKTVDHLHSARVEAPTTGGEYGCGWIFLNVGPLGRAMMHNGSNTNSQALIWILPDKDFAAVACTNTGEQSGFLACDEAIRNLMIQYVR